MNRESSEGYQLYNILRFLQKSGCWSAMYTQMDELHQQLLQMEANLRYNKEVACRIWRKEQEDCMEIRRETQNNSEETCSKSLTIIESKEGNCGEVLENKMNDSQNYFRNEGMLNDLETLSFQQLKLKVLLQEGTKVIYELKRGMTKLKELYPGSERDLEHNMTVETMRSSGGKDLSEREQYDKELAEEVDRMDEYERPDKMLVLELEADRIPDSLVTLYRADEVKLKECQRAESGLTEISAGDKEPVAELDLTRENQSDCNVILNTCTTVCKERDIACEEGSQPTSNDAIALGAFQSALKFQTDLVNEKQALLQKEIQNRSTLEEEVVKLKSLLVEREEAMSYERQNARFVEKKYRKMKELLIGAQRELNNAMESRSQLEQIHIECQALAVQSHNYLQADKEVLEQIQVLMEELKRNNVDPSQVIHTTMQSNYLWEAKYVLQNEYSIQYTDATARQQSALVLADIAKQLAPLAAAMNPSCELFNFPLHFASSMFLEHQVNSDAMDVPREEP